MDNERVKIIFVTLDKNEIKFMVDWHIELYKVMFVIWKKISISQNDSLQLVIRGKIVNSQKYQSSIGELFDKYNKNGILYIKSLQEPTFG